MNNWFDVENDWRTVLADELKKPYMEELQLFLEKEYKNNHVYPNGKDLFQALKLTAYQRTKVVILGQDPYHQPNQAHGLSFSVRKGVRIPPSLRNIFKELEADLGCPPPNHGMLTHWAKQGVLLLNTVLTVREGEPQSHQGMGWEHFTDAIIQALNARKTPVIYLLWGKSAMAKQTLISSQHDVLASAHPSPLSARRGFFGSRPFSKVNQLLAARGEEVIEWGIPND
ncbi:uracil-DNA glycosylase [Bacillus sp. JCM 19034]|uniref:uracil-DNA glycosylase n=1 Tax=Bacillus sp. JCM 19034 TaxID=1481928 RepID=UPI000780DF46|nr:uracil-DNA glycosylase [Bacillus sp. JCM 19034]